jgi:phospholipase D1/2
LRWVIYRQLRDFISLHTHYRFSNVYNRIPDALPEFPRTSASPFLLGSYGLIERFLGLPYFKFLSREKGDQIAQSDFARLQRAALEEYLIRLIKAVVSLDIAIDQLEV